MIFGRGGSDSVWSLLKYRAQADEQNEWLKFVPSGGGEEKSFTPAEVRDMALIIADQLLEAGVRSGDRVAILSPNSAYYVPTIFAITRLGATVVTFNWLLSPREIAYQLSHAQPSALVTVPQGIALATDAISQTEWQGLRFAHADPAAPQPDSAWTLVRTSGPVPADADLPPEPAADSLFEILYTSGSTGNPKGVMLTHLSVVLAAHRLVGEWSLRPDDVFLTPLPLYHVNAQFMNTTASLACGGRLVLQDRFSASRWIDEVRAHEATVVALTGTQVRMISAQPPRDDDGEHSMRFIPYGLNVPEEMWSDFEKRFRVKLVNIYGLTEGVGVVASSPLFNEARVPSCGRAHLDRPIAIMGEGDRPLVNEPGEICLKGEPGVTLMLGYYQMPEATADTLRGGWLRTGDIGVMDEDGFLSFVDRKKDVIKRSGENISALEVETVIMEHPAVAEVAVLGRPDPIREEEVVAFVVVAQDQALSTDELAEFCRARLARFKVPTAWFTIDALPRNTVGKVAKQYLRKNLDAESNA